MPPRLTTPSELESALAAERTLLFKHSPTCPISAAAFAEYEAWAAAHPTFPTGWIEVVQERPLARALAERTGVKHESPQALLLESGRAIWHASHTAITRASLAESTESGTFLSTATGASGDAEPSGGRGKKRA